MNELQVFKNEEFGEVRSLLINDEPYFVGKDVTNILGYQNGSRDVNRHVDDDDKITYQIIESGQRRNMILINESGLYSLILSSKLPTAKKFKRWVTKEVLPSIRKTGSYNAVPKTYKEALLELVAQVEENEKLQLENQEMKPKAIFADAVATSEDSILIGQLAKLISQNGNKIGQNRLFEWLRKNGFLCSRGENYNMPSQKSMEMGLMEIKERTIHNPDGSVRVTKTTKITGKGQIYFVNKFKKETSLKQTA